MTEAEKAAHDALIADVKKATEGVMSEKVAAALEAAGFKTELTALEGKLIALEAAKTAEELTALKSEVEKLALDLKAASEKPAAGKKTPSTIEILKTGKTTDGNGQEKSIEDMLTAMQKTKSASLSFSVKAVGTITTGSVTPTASGGIAQLVTDFDPSTTSIPRVRPFFMDYMRTTPITTEVASWAEMKNPEGGAGMTAEGTLKSQADFEYVEAKANVETVTAFIKSTKQALADIPQLAGDIDGELRTLVLLKADGQAFDGDGTSPNLRGVADIAPAFSAGVLAGTVVNPNVFDVLVAAINQIETAEVISGTPAGFLPTHAFINNADMAGMRLTKGTDEHYVFPYTMATGQILNITLVENPLVPAGDFLVGDMTKAVRRMREEFNITMGYENDDFTKNLVTILGEMRLCTYVKSNHVKAFVYDSFDNAIALLEIPT